MRDESNLQVTLKATDSSLVLSKVRSDLVARGRRDALALVKSSPSQPTDLYSETRQRAEAGSAWAQCELGKAYENGDGVAQDFAEAAKWYRKAAEQGNGPAQQYLGALYRDGRGVPQDLVEALKWFIKATEGTYEDDAKVELGWSYFKGIGFPKDYAEGVKWFRAVEHDYMGYAHLYLGQAYARGDGVQQDLAEAVLSWKIAADGEDLTGGFAHLMLGCAYSNGDGVPRDYVSAYMWFALATAYGTDAERPVRATRRDEVAKLLTPERLEEARRLAREWDAQRFGSDSETNFD